MEMSRLSTDRQTDRQTDIHTCEYRARILWIVNRIRNNHQNPDYPTGYSTTINTCDYFVQKCDDSVCQVHHHHYRNVKDDQVHITFCIIFVWVIAITIILTIFKGTAWLRESAADLPGDELCPDNPGGVEHRPVWNLLHRHPQHGHHRHHHQHQSINLTRLPPLATLLGQCVGWRPGLSTSTSTLGTIQETPSPSSILTMETKNVNYECAMMRRWMCPMFVQILNQVWDQYGQQCGCRGLLNCWQDLEHQSDTGGYFQLKYKDKDRTQSDTGR